MKFVLIVPTRNAGSGWRLWLDAIEQQTLRPDKIIVIDSSSTDDTVQLARQAGITVHSISPESFNHGGTRNYAAKLAGKSDVLVFLTQDAVLSQPQSLECLLSCFADPAVSAVCGRQLPHDNANPLAVHARMFNYPGRANA